jgi:uncharacterized protein (DUF2132 family)
MSYDEKVEATLEYVRDQSWESLLPDLIRWLEKTSWAVESFEDFYVEQALSSSDDDGNEYEG